MKRPVLTGLLLASVVALIALVVVMRSAVQKTTEQTAPAAVKNITVTLDDQSFTLEDGAAEKEAAPGSVSKNVVRIVGEPAVGDATGDGKPDSALLIENDPGGSGTFYYAVLAVNRDGSYRATNAVALGDRIVPEDIEFTEGHFVYRFLERKPGEPMAAEPSAQTRVVINVDPATDKISVG